MSLSSQKRQDDISSHGATAAAGKKVVRFDLSQGVDMEESEDSDDTSDGGDDDDDDDDEEEEEEEEEVEEIVREPLKPATYVSPHRREGSSDAKGRTLERLRRRVQGLINRLAWRQFFHCNSNI